MVRESPDFSPFAEIYATARPRYPEDLYGWLSSMVDCRELAWDSATGNGQAAAGLAASFERVVASDVSWAQLRFALRDPRIGYCVGRAEESPLVSGSVDLVVAAAAVHWFDLDSFWREVERVTRPGSVLAVWSYHVAHLRGAHAARVHSFYENEVKEYFGVGARWVDSRYEDLVLPGTPLEVPPFHVSAEWTLAELLRFVRSWSGVQKSIAETGRDPVSGLADDLARAWGDEGSPVVFHWPIYAKATRL